MLTVRRNASKKVRIFVAMIACGVVAGLSSGCDDPRLVHWYLNDATPEERAAVDAGLAQREQERRWYEAVLANQQAVRNHPFLVCVREHESGHNYTAQNPTSSASGAYQYLDSSWQTLSARAGYPGWSRAKYAPPDVQDAVTLHTYNNGGRSHWNGTGCR